MSIRLILYLGLLLLLSSDATLKKWNVQNQLVFFLVADMRTQWENTEIINILNIISFFFFLVGGGGGAFVNWRCCQKTSC